MSVNIEHGRRGGREPINTSTLFAEGVQSTEFRTILFGLSECKLRPRNSFN